MLYTLTVPLACLKKCKNFVTAFEGLIDFVPVSDAVVVPVLWRDLGFEALGLDLVDGELHSHLGPHLALNVIL